MKFLNIFFSKYIKRLGKLATFLIGFFVFALVAFFIVYIKFARDLPDISSLNDYHPPVISEVYAQDGNKIGEFWEECRIFLSHENIPPLFAKAFIATEDDRFYEHKGIDVKAIFRAAVANLKSNGIFQGASTITQQVTRSLLLSREKTFSRKIKEAILSLRLERKLSKQQILTLYLNQIYLGNRAYGIEAAARNYFHKHANELSLGQIALIAGLPSAPSKYSPVVNPDAARKRQTHVLRRMLHEGIITATQMEEALQESFPLYVAGLDTSFHHKPSLNFVEYVRRLVKEKYGDEVLYHKGLKIYTSLDLATQEAAFHAIQNGARKLDRRQGYRGTFGHIDPEAIEAKANEFQQEMLNDYLRTQLKWPPEKNNIVPTLEFKKNTFYKAIVKGFTEKNVDLFIGTTHAIIPFEGYKWARSYNTKVTGYDDANYVSNPKNILKAGDIILVSLRDDNESFDLAQVPEVQAALFALDPKTGFVKALIGGNGYKDSEFNRATQSLRSPGSSFKPFVYAAALDKGYSFDTKIIDEPIVYEVGENDLWAPKNYDGKYKGELEFRTALMQSRNVPTVKIAHDIGTEYLTGFARKFGFTSPIEKYLSMSLGSNGVYLSELTQSYAVFANDGKMTPTVFISKIEDAQGNILEEFSAKDDYNFEVPTNDNTETPIAETLDAVSDALEKEVKPQDLNLGLFSYQQEFTKGDQLQLTDLEIKTLYGKDIAPGHVITPQTAYLMTTLLQGVVQGGTGTAVRALNKPAAGKTGTTNDETDAWFVGFVPQLVAGVWVGFDQLKPIGKTETGGRTAAPLFLEFMQEATKDMETLAFTPPQSFPQSNIANLSGGSALFGLEPHFEVAEERAQSDKAGSFFEEDFEQATPDLGGL